MTVSYKSAEPIWCAGCGHFGVQGSLAHAISHVDIPAHETFILAGIGCSGTVQNNLGTYGYHAMHGRVLPTAIGTALANPSLMVIAVGGDGDGYAIGAGHLVHALKRNPNIVYIVMNNATYGLTKGQNSPTSSTDSGIVGEGALDAITLGLSIFSTSFIARGFTSKPTQLNELMIKALQHVQARRGMAFIEILSPCVTYNDTYPEWGSMVVNINEADDYDHHNREMAMATVMGLKTNNRIPLGLIYQGDVPSLDKIHLKDNSEAPALKSFTDGNRKQQLKEILSGYGLN